jgi:alkanesulfonate monooxygenase SsuD/methylene tetrahydromethanopterin reductase-like flavin-dependent oxidoreductase (luciferase family)
MTYGLVVARDAEKEAKDAFQRGRRRRHRGAAENVIKIAGVESESFEHAKTFQERLIAGWGGYPLVGTPEQVVEELRRLNEAGMDGMIMVSSTSNEEL